MTDAPVISDAVVEAACLVKFGPNWRTLPEIYKPKLLADMRAAIQAAVLAERDRAFDEGVEACASVMDTVVNRETGDALRKIKRAAAIRARSTGGEK